MYDYEEYEDGEVINESALDMAMDMSDRYGIAIEDAYDFACDAMEGSLKDPHKRELRERNRFKIACDAHDGDRNERNNKIRRFSKALGVDPVDADDDIIPSHRTSVQKFVNREKFVNRDGITRYKLDQDRDRARRRRFEKFY